MFDYSKLSDRRYSIFNKIILNFSDKFLMIFLTLKDGNAKNTGGYVYPPVFLNYIEKDQKHESKSQIGKSCKQGTLGRLPFLCLTVTVSDKVLISCVTDTGSGIMGLEYSRHAVCHQIEEAGISGLNQSAKTQ